MTPTSPSSNGSPIEHTTSNSHAYRVVRKRNRVPLSCGPCRSRKLKCNRAVPCENCVRRNDSHSCTYATTVHSSRTRKASAASSGGGSSDEMQSRIDRLENLVLSLMQGNHNVSPRNSSSAGDENSPNAEDEYGEVEGDGDDAMNEYADELEDDVDEVRNALGIMKIHQGSSFYRGETHWAVVLSEITEVKKFFEETKQKYENEIENMKSQSVASKLQATGFPFSAGRPPTKQEILSLVPRQELVDLLVDAFFRNYDPIIHVLHRPSFYKQYEAFWRDPSGADTLWLALLMIILSIAITIYQSTGGEPLELFGKTLEMGHAFRAAAEQCLIVGDYTKKPYLHTIQTLIFMSVSGAGSKTSPDATWMYMGLVVRLAMSMGLHRDPRMFPAIPPGEAELRRRLWTTLNCIDLLMSIQIGLPTIIKQEECDTQLPLNLHDDEINENLAVLPPERPREELTGTSYMIVKSNMAYGLWEIVRQVNSIHPRPPYEQALELEQDINNRYASIPSFLRMKPSEDSLNDPAWLIIQRHYLDLLRQKALLTLHRPYASKARFNARFIHSHRQVVEAAMQLLKLQNSIYILSRNVLHHARWFTEFHGTHEFLHAAMIISLDLSCPNFHPALQHQRYTKQDKYIALCRALEITRVQQDRSIEASKAHGVLVVIMEKLRKENPEFRKPENCTSVNAAAAAVVAAAVDCPTSNITQQPTPSDSDKSSVPPTVPTSMDSISSDLYNTPAYTVLYDKINSAGAVTTPGGTGMLLTGSNTPGDDGGGGGGGGVLASAAAGDEMWSGAGEWDEWDEFMQLQGLDASHLGFAPGLGTPAYQIGVSGGFGAGPNGSSATS